MYGQRSLKEAVKSYVGKAHVEQAMLLRKWQDGCDHELGNWCNLLVGTTDACRRSEKPRPDRLISVLGCFRSRVTGCCLRPLIPQRGVREIDQNGAP